MQAGHWRQSGNHPYTRYDERNISGQCDRCNVILHGLEADHERHLRLKWGDEAIDEVYNNSFMRKKWDIFQLMAIEKDFKDRAMILADKKNLTIVE